MWLSDVKQKTKCQKKIVMKLKTSTGVIYFAAKMKNTKAVRTLVSQ